MFRRTALSINHVTAYEITADSMKYGVIQIDEAFYAFSPFVIEAGPALEGNNMCAKLHPRQLRTPNASELSFLNGLQAGGMNLRGIRLTKEGRRIYPLAYAAGNEPESHNDANQ